MELNILLEGTGAEHEADRLAARISNVRILSIDATMLDDAYSICALIDAKHVKPDVLVFTGPIATPEVLAECVKAVRTYRTSGTNAAKIDRDRLTRRERDAGTQYSPDLYDVSAIFICGPGVIVLQSKCVHEDCQCPKGHPCDRQCKPVAEVTNVPRRTDMILADLWDRCSEIVTGEGATAMTDKLDELTGRPGSGLHHLDIDGRIALHEYLLPILHHHEQD